MSWKFAGFGYENFENPLFMTYMHNMHIKWKLKTYQMQIRGWNCNLTKFLGEKSIFKNFGFNFQKKIFFEIKIFQKFSNTTPQNFFSNYFKHQKWQLQLGLTSPALFHAQRQVVKVDPGRFLPPPALLGLNLASMKSS